jgi:hypothetical protein
MEKTIHKECRHFFWIRVGEKFIPILGPGGLTEIPVYRERNIRKEEILTPNYIWMQHM